MVIGTYLQSMNLIYFIYKKQCLVVLRLATIGVLRSTPATPRGSRISSMAIRATALRASLYVRSLLGLFNHLTI